MLLHTILQCVLPIIDKKNKVYLSLVNIKNTAKNNMQVDNHADLQFNAQFYLK